MDTPLTYSVPSLKANTTFIVSGMRAEMAQRSASARTLLACVVAASFLWTSPAWSQRVAIPTMVESSAVSAPTSTATPWMSGSSTFAQPSASPLAGSAYDPYAAPLAQAAPPAFNPPPTTYSPYVAPPPAAYSPYAPSPYAPTPYAATPYSPAPYGSSPSALYPEGVAWPQQGGFSIGEPLRFLQDIRLRSTWLSPMGSNSLGVSDFETNVTFAVPFFKTTSPLMITPGFAMHFWDGPVTETPYFADLPPQTYDAYLDAGWYPQITPWLSAQVGVRVGAYTDFNTFSTNSIRTMGRGLGVITVTPTLQFALGVVYIDRVDIKLLPAGGIIWTPNPDARYEILFPNPKLSRRMTTLGNTDVWFYGTGEYGGGSWTIQRTSPLNSGNDQVDYNDIRVAGGLESYSLRGFHGFFEVGYVFDRKLVYRSATPSYPASDTIMLRGGIAY